MSISVCPSLFLSHSWSISMFVSISSFMFVFLLHMFWTKGPFYSKSHLTRLMYGCVCKCLTRKAGAHCGSLPSPAQCGTMWIRVMYPSSTQATHPPPPAQTTKAQSTSSLTEGWTWLECTKKLRTQPNPWPASVKQCEHCHLFSN